MGKMTQNRSDSPQIAQNRGGGLTGSRDQIGLALHLGISISIDVSIKPGTLEQGGGINMVGRRRLTR